MSSGIRIIVSNTQQTTTDVQRLSDNFEKAIVKRAQDRAASLRTKLRSRTEAAYAKTGTGRFSRGLNARVVVEGGGTNTKATIFATMVTYRENRFLTELAGVGPPPTSPYYIFARGLRDLFDTRLTSKLGKQYFGPQGEKLRNSWFRLTLGFARKQTSHRLKVPAQGLISIPTRSGRERRQAIMGPALGSDLTGRFYYPLWVKHPGFAKQGDVVLETILEAAAQMKEEVLADAVVSFNPAKPEAGITFTGSRVRRVSTTSPPLGSFGARATAARGIT